jgi:hypothetical protein
MGPDGPVYPGTCRPSFPYRGAFAPAPDVAWRLDMARAMEWATTRHGSLAWEDERRGLQQADPLPFGDVVLWRKDAPASYHLAATLDDAADGVSVVTRGVDCSGRAMSIACFRPCWACRCRAGIIMACWWDQTGASWPSGVGLPDWPNAGWPGRMGRPWPGA